jgi:hypothetical protein
MPNNNKRGGDERVGLMSFARSMSAKAFDSGVKVILENSIGPIRALISQINNISDNSEKFVRLLLLLAYITGKKTIGAMVETFFNTPQLKPILLLSKLVGCIERSQTGKAELGISDILNSKTTQHIQNTLSTVQTSVDQLSKTLQTSVDVMLGYVGEKLNHPNTPLPNLEFVASSGIQDAAREILQALSVVLHGVELCQDVIRNAMFELGPSMPTAFTFPSTSVTEGGRGKTQLRYKDRIYKVREDRHGKRYILCNKQHLYLSSIRGQYRYV